jgi:hypothetical protein
MKIFISSLITDMHEERSVVREAIEQLDHEPIMAEQFGGQPNSSQVACLNGVRDSAAVVLVLGEKYGVKQPSGISATHEEYREARRARQVFAFVKEGISPDADQAKFISEVQAWDSGLHRRAYKTVAGLRKEVTNSLHRWQLSNAAAPLDPSELSRKALGNLPSDRNSSRMQSPALAVSIATGPSQQVLRPSELESKGLARELMKQAMFCDQPIFDVGAGSHFELLDDTLRLSQESAAYVTLDGEGSIVMITPVDQDRSHIAIVEENVRDKLNASVTYAAWLLDRVDPTQRLTHFVIAANIVASDYLSWRTRAEEAASPNSGHMRSSGDSRKAVQLKPVHRPRGELKSQADEIVTDLITLLRRQNRA